MKTNLLTTVCAFLVCCCSQVQPAQPETELLSANEVATLSARSTVHISYEIHESLDDPEAKTLAYGWASGVIISTKGRRVYIATAKHLTELGKSVPPPAELLLVGALEKRGTLGEITVEEQIEGCDAAIVSMELVAPPAKGSIHPIQLSNEEPAVGDEIVITGNQGVTWDISLWSRVAGICGSTMDCMACSLGKRCYIIDRPLFPGISGAPVVNTQGKLVGIATDGVFFPIDSKSAQVGAGTFVSISAIRSAIKRYTE